METNNQINSFIRLVMNENLAQAQTVIRDALNEKLSAALDEKFEAYAPAIFEEVGEKEEKEELDDVDVKDGDINNNGIPDSNKKQDPSGAYLKNRRDAIGDAINEEEGDEGDEGDETDEDETEEAPKSKPQVTQEMMPQNMQSSGSSSGSASDGY
jgi:hypothetical protein